jgi:hypothetical protein
MNPSASGGEQHDLTLILKSRFPLVAIETHEEPRVLALLERIADANGWMLFIWSLVDGLRRSNNTNTMTSTRTLTECLAHVNRTPQGGLYVLLDADCLAAAWLARERPSALRAATSFVQRMGPGRVDRVHPSGSARAAQLAACGRTPNGDLRSSSEGPRSNAAATSFK